MTQNAETLPMAYAGTRRAHAGCGTPMRCVTCRASATTAKRAAMKNSCPISTPTLKNSSATGSADCGSRTSLNALAKPKPCSKPNVNATIHVNLSVVPVLPCRLCTISAATRTRIKIKDVNVRKVGEVFLVANTYTAIGSGANAGKRLDATASHVLVHAGGEWLSALHTAR